MYERAEFPAAVFSRTAIYKNRQKMMSLRSEYLTKNIKQIISKPNRFLHQDVIYQTQRYDKQRSTHVISKPNAILMHPMFEKLIVSLSMKLTSTG